MAKAELYGEVRNIFGGHSLEDLEIHAERCLSCLMGEEWVDEEVRDELVTLLSLKVLIWGKRIEVAGNAREQAFFETLRDYYTAIFRVPGPGVKDQGVYTYCVDQSDYYAALGDEERKKKWSEMANAMERVIRGETVLDKQIAAEIAGKSDDNTFLPDEWLRWRKDGREPSEIDYDMCHVWR